MTSVTTWPRESIKCMGCRAFKSGLYATAMALISTASATGDELGSYRNKAELSIGAFFTDNGTNIQLNSETLGIGTKIDVENDLDLEESETVFRVDGYWRFGKQGKHRVDGSFFSVSRHSSTTIDEDFQFGDEVFPIEATIETDFDVWILKTEYTYMLFQGERYEVGASVGAFILDFEASIGEESRGKLVSSDVTLPLPTLGFRGNVELLPGLVFKAHANVFLLSYGKYDGTLYEYLAGLEYALTERVGLGVAYNYVDMSVDVDRAHYDFGVDWTYQGTLVYMKFVF